MGELLFFNRGILRHRDSSCFPCLSLPAQTGNSDMDNRLLILTWFAGKGANTEREMPGNNVWPARDAATHSQTIAETMPGPALVLGMPGMP